MADSRFFKIAGPFTLGQLAGMTGSELSDPAAADKVITDVAPLQDAGSSQLSFLDNKKYAAVFRDTKAGACFVRADVAGAAPAHTVCLVNSNPYKAYALAAQAFYPEAPAQEFRASTAVIDPAARLGANCHVDHGAVIGPNVVIGDNVRIGALAVIEAGVEIGANCDIGARAYITHAVLGRHVRIYPGAVIGRPGFGFAIDPAGFVSVPQLGRVLIGDHVEIGANTTVDRGAGPDTVIGAGTRIDNLVQIGHNVQIGRACVIVAQTGISGSTRIGDFVMIGGQTGVAGHLTIGSGVKIAAQSGIMRDIEPKAEVMGSPAAPVKQYMRQVALLNKMTGRKGDEK